MKPTNRTRRYEAVMRLSCVPAMFFLVWWSGGSLRSATAPTLKDSAGHRKLTSRPCPSTMLTWTTQIVTASVFPPAADRDGTQQAASAPGLVPLVSWWRGVVYGSRWPSANTTASASTTAHSPSQKQPLPLRPVVAVGSAVQRRHLRTDLLAHLQSLQDPRPPTAINTNTGTATPHTQPAKSKSPPAAPPAPPSPESLSPPSARAPPPDGPQTDSLETALVEAALALIEDAMGAAASSPNGYRRLHPQRRLRRRGDGRHQRDYSPSRRHFNHQSHAPAPQSSPEPELPPPAPASAKDVSVVPSPFQDTPTPHDNKQLGGTATPQRVGLLGALRGIMQRRQGQRQANKQEGDQEGEGGSDKKKEPRRPLMERMEDQWLQRSEQQLMGRQRQNFQAMQAAITGILADSATEDEGL